MVMYFFFVVSQYHFILNLLLTGFELIYWETNTIIWWTNWQRNECEGKINVRKWNEAMIRFKPSTQYWGFYSCVLSLALSVLADRSKRKILAIRFAGVHEVKMNQFLRRSKHRFSWDLWEIPPMGFYECQFGEFGFYPEGTGKTVKAFDPGYYIHKAVFTADIGKLKWVGGN